MIHRYFFTLAGVFAGLASGAGSERIRVNQVGYVVGQPKLAISLNAGTSGSLVDSLTGQPVFQAVLGAAKIWAAAGDTGRTFDFTSFDQPGTYYVLIGSEQSHPVHIAADPFLALSRGSIKAYWLTRSSYAPKAPWAGPWARTAGHPDIAVLVHGSAATAARPEGSTIRSPGGWYDAGDYGKYVVNSGISTWTLLHLYESAPTFFDTLSLNVPPHGGPTSDLVDEILWNLRWMLTMQDPDDGGVYHKLTTADFSGFVMPANDKADRYVVQKSTAATLDLAAVSAYAARLFRGNPDLPGFADSCQATALAAWAWARANPSILYNQDTVNAYYSPAITTGTYGNGDVSDEFDWAASELFLTTGLDSFAVVRKLANQLATPTTWGWPGWADVRTLGWLSLLSNPSLLTGSLAGYGPKLDSGLTKTTATIRDYRKSNGYHVPQGGFWWGGNSAFGNNGLLLWKAWQVTGDTSYLSASLEVLDYLLGRNATGYSFVTGFGGKSPMNPHHRPSFADGVVAPYPGLLVGGPNSSAEAADLCTDYPSTVGPKVYVDDYNCYASNEVAINWNAPLAYLTGVWSARQEGALTSIHAVTPLRATRLVWSRRGSVVTASLAGKTLSRLDLVAPDGRILSRQTGPGSSLSADTKSSGLVLARVWATDGTSAGASILLP